MPDADANVKVVDKPKKSGAFAFQTGELYKALNAATVNNEFRQEILQAIASLKDRTVPDNLLTDENVLVGFITKYHGNQLASVQMFLDSFQHKIKSSFERRVDNLYDEVISKLESRPDRDAARKAFNVVLAYLQMELTDEGISSKTEFLKSMQNAEEKLAYRYQGKEDPFAAFLEEVQQHPSLSAAHPLKTYKSQPKAENPLKTYKCQKALLHDLFPEAPLDRHDGVVGFNFADLYSNRSTTTENGHVAKVKPIPDASFVDLPDPIIRMIGDKIFGIYNYALEGYEQELRDRSGACADVAKRLHDSLDLLGRHGQRDPKDVKGIKKIDFFDGSHYTNLNNILVNACSQYHSSSSSGYKGELGDIKKNLDAIHALYQENKKGSVRS